MYQTERSRNDIYNDTVHDGVFVVPFEFDQHRLHYFDGAISDTAGWPSLAG